MGYVDEGDADLLLDRLELDLHLLAQFQVERAKRLVQEQDSGAVDERPGQRDPLPLAAGKLGWLAVPKGREAHHAQGFGHTALAFCAVDPAHHEAIADVVGHVHVREERVVLEDGVYVAIKRRNAGHVAPMQEDAPRRRLLESGDHPQGRGLP